VHVRKLFTREPGDPASGLGEMVQGPRCESGRNTTATYGGGKSDRLIVAEKRSNKDDGVPWSAENVEPSSLTKGNSLQSTKYRTQRRGGL
jgi:hypothetical protein